MKVNLTELASEIALEEGLKESVSVAQVSEILGILGRRWRSEVSVTQASAEFAAIVARAGGRREN